MNKIIILVVLVLVVGGAFLLFSGSKSSNESMVGEGKQNAETTMPANETESMTDEKSVVKEFTIESKGLSFTPSEIKVNV